MVDSVNRKFGSNNSNAPNKMDQTGPMKLLVVAHVIYKSHFGRKNGEKCYKGQIINDLVKMCVKLKHIYVLRKIMTINYFDYM